MRNKLSGHPISREELVGYIGERKTEIGRCFSANCSSNKHYYLQRNDDVLHVNIGVIDNTYLINVLYDNVLNDIDSLIECEIDEFNAAYKYAIDGFNYKIS